LGFPVLGDVLYNGDGSLYLKMTRDLLTTQDRESLGFPRLALHAFRITFPHPVTSKKLRIAAPVPPDMAGLLAAYGMTKIDKLSSL
jgi:23S rRNA-/tRNA-specific pseudouridylate synthase